MRDDYDVVVVGAGVAGLTAGARLHAAGRSVMVLEAANRVGGRAFTDTETFGIAWDRGCHWLHSASVNPLRAAADELGFAYLARPGRRPPRTHLGTRWAEDSEAEAIWAAVTDTFEAVHAAGAAGQDVPASACFDSSGPWLRLIRHWLSMLSAADAERISSLDYAAYDDTAENYPVERGYGALIAAVIHRMAPDLPVRTACPVQAIDWSGGDVAITTPQGTLRAGQVVIAVPTSVLAGDAIRFTPALPVEMQEACAALPLGVAEKVALLFDRDVFGVPETTYMQAVDLRDPGRRPLTLTLNPFGQPLAISLFGGGNAADLVAAGPAAMAEFTLSALVDAFGSDIRARVRAVATTAWAADPLIGGGYSCALPGFGAVRARLGTVIGGRLRFAGEAVSAHAFSTAHGAYETGLMAAEAILADAAGPTA